MRHMVIKCCNFRFDLADITVEPVLFLYMFGNFLYFPTFQALIFNKACISSYNSTFCEDIQHNKSFKDAHKDEHDHVTSETSYWILRSSIALTVTSFFIVILLLGPLGDKWGRKYPVILPCIGALLAYISGLMNSKYMTAPLGYILIGPVLNGLCGGFIAVLMSVYSYVGHIASSETKMRRVGILESMIFLSGTIGIFVSGVMLERQGYIVTFIFLCVITVVAIVYSVVWLENVHTPPSEMLERESCGKSMLRFMTDTFHCVGKRRSGWTLPALVLQVLVLDVLMLCTAGDMDISLLYLREHMDFSQTMYGYVKGLDNFLRGIMLILLLPLLKGFFVIKDLPLVMVGLISYSGAFIITGLAQTKWLIFIATVVGMLKGFPSAGLRSMMSKMVTKEEQGRLFGLIAATESVVSLLASLLFNMLYPATQSFMPGLCYLIGAGLALLMILVIGFVHWRLSKSGSVPYTSFSEDETAIVNGMSEA